MDERTSIALIGILLAFAVLYGYFYSRRARSLLEGWATKNGVGLVYAERRLLRKGPFIWSSRGQVVYRIEVLDQKGNDRRGWVRCGSWLLGVLANQVEVKWDGE